MNSFFVYILRCVDGSFYTGHTDDLERRMSEHQNQQLPCYTSIRLPVELVYHATFKTRDEAIEAERKIKGWSRAKKKALINNDFRYIQLLSERRKKLTLRDTRCARPQGERNGKLYAYIDRRQYLF